MWGWAPAAVGSHAVLDQLSVLISQQKGAQHWKVHSMMLLFLCTKSMDMHAKERPSSCGRTVSRNVLSLARTDAWK